MLWWYAVPLIIFLYSNNVKKPLVLDKCYDRNTNTDTLVMRLIYLSKRKKKNVGGVLFKLFYVSERHSCLSETKI